MIDRQLNYGPKVVREFLERARPYVDVLDIGAGSGRDLSIAKDIAPQAVLNAIEVYPAYADQLRAKGINVSSIDLERNILPFDSESFDVVIANQVLEHTKELFWIHHEISRVLRIGGSLIIGVPNLASLHNRIMLLMGLHPTSVKNRSAHIRGFTKIDLIHFLNHCFQGGYRCADFGGSNFYPLPPQLAKVGARIWPNAAYSIFLRFQKAKKYHREFLDYLDREQLETNFYRG